MRKKLFGFTILVAFLFILSGCDYIGLGKDNPVSYRGCLKESFNGSHNYTAEETRSLCEEITLTAEPFYRFEGGEIVPGDEFTKCYEEEYENLKSKGREDAEEFAKLLCKYAPK